MTRKTRTASRTRQSEIAPLADDAARIDELAKWTPGGEDKPAGKRRARKEAEKARRSRKPKAAPADVTEAVLDRAEIATRLEAATKTAGKFDRVKTVFLAELNGLQLNPALDNGRTAMNVRNQLRSRALHGVRVVWG